MSNIRDFDEWNFGRRGEILADIILARNGFTLLDAAGSGNRATTLHRYQADLVAPDYLGIMTRPLWFEIKTKGTDWIWHGGGRDTPRDNRLPPGRAQGIDAVAYDRYRDDQRATGMPVVLLLIIVPTGEMIANTIDALGQPYPSVKDEIPMVNWPTSRFIQICTFNHEQLDKYFYVPRLAGDTVRRPLRAPVHMPERHRRELWYERLQPEQRELTGFRQHLFEHWNKRWTA